MCPTTLFRYETSQLIPASLDDVWDFFCEMKNLTAIMPPEMGLRIVTPESPRVEPGLIVICKVRMFANFSTQWVTQITHVEPKRFFIDEQPFGPFRYWHHRHSFEQTEGGVLVKDLVYYALPVPFGAQLINELAGRPRMEAIFSYRKKKIAEIFGAAAS